MRPLDHFVVCGFIAFGIWRLIVGDGWIAPLLLWSGAVWRWAIACREDAEKWRERLLDEQKNGDLWFSACMAETEHNAKLLRENKRLMRLLESSGEGWRI